MKSFVIRAYLPPMGAATPRLRDKVVNEVGFRFGLLSPAPPMVKFSV